MSEELLRTSVTTGSVVTWAARAATASLTWASATSSSTSLDSAALSCSSAKAAESRLAT